MSINTRAISIGSYHTLGIKADKTAWAWGDNSEGELGIGTDDFNIHPSPLQIHGEGDVGFLSDVALVVAGRFSSFAISNSGTVYAWGYNTQGQCGIGTNAEYVYTPTKVLGPGGVGYLTGIVDIAPGSYFCLFLKSDGTVWATGLNSGFYAGVLGDGTNVDKNIVVQVKDISGTVFLSSIVSICGAFESSYAVDSSGNVWAWGRNTRGQLGQNNTTGTLLPVQVKGVGGTGFLTGISKLATGLDTGSLWANVIAIRSSDGAVFGWGANRFGSLGDGTTTQRLVPVQTLGIGGAGTLSGAVDISVGNGNVSLAVLSSGEVIGWGVNSAGELGNGSFLPTERHYPDYVLEVGGVGNMSLLTNSGKLRGWGENFLGQLGDGNTNNISTPEIPMADSWLVPSGSGLPGIISSSYPTLALAYGPVGPTLVSITVTPANQIIFIGDLISYTATGTYSDSSTADLTGSVTWASSIPTVAPDPMGGITNGVSLGITIITATLGAISGNTSLTVGAHKIRNPRLRFLFGLSNIPLVGYYLYTCIEHDSSGLNRVTTWQDYEKTISNSNPIILDSAGYSCPIFCDRKIKLFLKTPVGGLVASYDSIWNTTLGLVQLAEADLQFWDKNGVPLAGGKLYTCLPGASTLNQVKVSYSNNLLTTLNSNPIILDSLGRAASIYAATFYKLFLFDANDVPILTQDDVGPS